MASVHAKIYYFYFPVLQRDQSSPAGSDDVDSWRGADLLLTLPSLSPRQRVWRRRKREKLHGQEKNRHRVLVSVPERGKAREREKRPRRLADRPTDNRTERQRDMEETWRDTCRRKYTDVIVGVRHTDQHLLPHQPPPGSTKPFACLMVPERPTLQASLRTPAQSSQQPKSPAAMGVSTLKACARTRETSQPIGRDFRTESKKGGAVARQKATTRSALHSYEGKNPPEYQVPLSHLPLLRSSLRFELHPASRSTCPSSESVVSGGWTELLNERTIRQGYKNPCRALRDTSAGLLFFFRQGNFLNKTASLPPPKSFDNKAGEREKRGLFVVQ